MCQPEPHWLSKQRVFVRLSAAVKFISYREIEAENANFQPSAWGFLMTKHSQRFANDVALALREKIAAGMDFESQTASELTTVEILVCSLDFVLEH